MFLSIKSIQKLLVTSKEYQLFVSHDNRVSLEAKLNWFVWTKLCLSLTVYMEYYVGNTCFNMENVWNYLGCLHFSMERSRFDLRVCAHAHPWPRKGPSLLLTRQPSHATVAERQKKDLRCRKYVIYPK